MKARCGRWRTSTTCRCMSPASIRSVSARAGRAANVRRSRRRRGAPATTRCAPSPRSIGPSASPPPTRSTIRRRRCCCESCAVAARTVWVGSPSVLRMDSWCGRCCASRARRSSPTRRRKDCPGARIHPMPIPPSPERASGPAGSRVSAMLSTRGCSGQSVIWPKHSEEIRNGSRSSSKAEAEGLLTEEDGGLRIARSGWEALPEALARRVARLALRRTGAARDISRVHLERVVNILRSGRPGSCIELPGGLELACEHDAFHLRRTQVPGKGAC